MLLREAQTLRIMEIKISSLPNCSTEPPISFFFTLLTKTKLLSSRVSIPLFSISSLMLSLSIMPSGSSLDLQWVTAMVRWFFSLRSFSMISSSKSSTREDLALRQKRMVLNQSLISCLS